MVGCVVQNFLEVVACFFNLVEGVVEYGQIIERVDVFGIRCDGFAIVYEGFFVAFQLEQGIGQVGVSVGEVRVEGNNLLVGACRVIKPACHKMNVAQACVNLQEVWFQCDGFLIVFESVIEPTQAVVRVASREAGFG